MKILMNNHGHNILRHFDVRSNLQKKQSVIMSNKLGI